MSNKEIKLCPTKDMIGYSTGEVANSLVANGIFGFAMIYYTDALGLSPTWAGWAMSIAVLWDAISDPLMGHISDNTRSRFGRRHQYMLFGGLAMVVSFFFIWMVPSVFKSNEISLFWYLVMMNIIFRTAYTVFIVPMTALGFEMCQDYTGRTKLQGIKAVTNMIANLCGPALAWYLFFKEKGDTAIAENYVRMGMAFSIGTLLSVLFLVFITRKYIVDSRQMKITGTGAKDFFKDIAEIIKDRYPRWVFAFTMLVLLGIGLVASLQMYLYEHFMKLDGLQKAITHGGTMVGMMFGALFASKVAHRMDKKGAVYVGVAISVSSGVIVSALFLPELVKPGQILTLAGFNIPIAMVLFAFFNSAYWFGNGVMLPVATSMIADVSELNEIKTGINKDGAYAAMYSFSMKFATSIALLTTGYCLALVGFETGKGIMHSHETVMKLFLATFIMGPFISLVALMLIKRYPVDKKFLEEKRQTGFSSDE